MAGNNNDKKLYNIIRYQLMTLAMPMLFRPNKNFLKWLTRIK